MPVAVLVREKGALKFMRSQMADAFSRLSSWLGVSRNAPLARKCSASETSESESMSDGPVRIPSPNDSWGGQVQDETMGAARGAGGALQVQPVLAAVGRPAGVTSLRSLHGDDSGLLLVDGQPAPGRAIAFLGGRRCGGRRRCRGVHLLPGLGGGGGGLVRRRRLLDGDAVVSLVGDGRGGVVVVLNSSGVPVGVVLVVGRVGRADLRLEVLVVDLLRLLRLLLRTALVLTEFECNPFYFLLFIT
ncbi:Thymidine kinase [Frankliniella fusca]|uniref:Thymidine kinase n=1 Tax=Frankliniella fusca TaxID=407009 RepID=A0AAE1LCX6_9NEOP|nr:Thymidine kinase [Frankliniella fusca]